MHPAQWIKVHPQGLYCEPGKFYIDPLYNVDAAVITHGHADHARSGHQKVLATRETLAIMTVRYGENFAASSQSLDYSQKLNINGVTISLFPAGHITGSAQILLEYQKSRLVISGDYKRAPDPTCKLFEPVSCDVFITEATFGMPFFKHPDITQEIKKLLLSLQDFPERCHLIGCYALGKCQRLICALRNQGYDNTIYLHGAMIKLCEVYQRFNIALGDLKQVTVENRKELGGKIVLCPPSALHDVWSRKLPAPIRGLASGWMQIRARAKQKGIDLPLVISDHADWQQLTTTLHEINAPEIWVTHGNEEALVYYARQQGYKAQALSIMRDE